MHDILQTFTDHLKEVLTRSLTYSVEHGIEHVSPIHLLHALSSQEGSIGHQILQRLDVKTDDIAHFLQSVDVTPVRTKNTPLLSEESRSIIEYAVFSANRHEHTYIGTEHLLDGILQSQDADIHAFFKKQHIDKEAIAKILRIIFATTTEFPKIFEKSPKDVFQSLQTSSKPAESAITDDSDDDMAALDFFAEELTQPKFVKTIDPVIGREEEILRLAQILARRTKNNPILIGEPGVGKSAIVEGLAKNIVRGNVPPALIDKQIYRLDLASLIAGTMYRGEFESRLKQLLEEIEERPEVILFIDEIHSIMGAGAATGSLDAASMLKPALARGQVRCIGATTPDEFKKTIETDGALERRFQPIYVNEPDLEKTLAILHGVKAHYEAFHQVSYTDDMLALAVQLANRYLHHKQFPDKAIDILDEAGALVATKRKARKWQKDLAEKKRQLREVQKRKEDAVAAEEFAKAMKEKELEEELAKSIENIKASKVARTAVEEQHIVTVVSAITSIPVSEIETKRTQGLKGLHTRLRKTIIGQDDIVKQVALALGRAKLGLGHEEKPRASFFFVGPSGVGKTALAKAISSEMFEESGSFLRLDMSEYRERHTISSLLGSPAGYIGYRDKNKLADHVKQHPHSVILFDEVEKAHPDVLHILLQILDNGRITDATGREIDFRQTIIVLTSNIGSEYFERDALGFSSGDHEQRNNLHKQILERAREQFSRELMNRIGLFCVFDQLSTAAVQKIVKKQLVELHQRLEKHGVDLRLPKHIEAKIAEQIETKFGARDIDRVIEKHIEHPLTEALLKLSADAKKRFSLKAPKTKAWTIEHRG